MVKGAGFNERHVVAQLLAQGSDAQGAEACLREAITLTLPAIRMLIKLLTSRGAFQDATSYSAALEALEPVGDNIYLHADLLSRLGHTDKALTRYEVLVASNQQNAKLWNAYGVTLATHGEMQKGIAALEKAVGLGANKEYAANLERVRAGSAQAAAAPVTPEALDAAQAPEE
jgi:tetratricopeptide (TPR) repeat protein